MATTNKSTKAKTKKPAAKSAKTNKAKSIKKPINKTTKKSNAKVTSKSQTKNEKKLKANLLTKLNILSVAVSLIGALAAGLLMSTKSYQVVVGHLTKDELASGAGQVLSPAVYHLYDVQLRYLVIVVLVLAAIIPLLNVTYKKAKYQSALKSKVVKLRWVEIGIVSALMMEILALLSGIQDIFVIKLIVGLMLVISALSWVAEKRNIQAGRPVYSELVIAIVAGILAWTIIAGYSIATPIYGFVSNTNYVYGLFAVMLLSFIGYGMNLINYVRRRGIWKNYETVERNYLLNSIATRVAFVSILVAGFLK